MKDGISILDYFPPIGMPFMVELQLTEDNAESASRLMRLCREGGEILPGIKVNKVFRAVENEGTLYTGSLLEGVVEEYKKLQEAVREFEEKVSREISKENARMYDRLGDRTL